MPASSSGAAVTGPTAAQSTSASNAARTCAPRPSRSAVNTKFAAAGALVKVTASTFDEATSSMSR